jgi:hypothetical protein
MRLHLPSWPRRALAGAAAILGLAVLGFAPGAALAQDAGRAFPETGFQIQDDAIWSFFTQNGGTDTFGYPISREFVLYGSPVQLFERAALVVQPDRSVQVLDLTDPGWLAYTHFNGSTVPAADGAIQTLTPTPSQPSYPARLSEFVRATVPDNWNGQPVGFYSLLGGDSPNLALWGVPTSRPAADPNNPSVIYQRFQRGIMEYDTTTGTTQSMLLGDYLKAVLTGQNLPSDLAQEAASSPLLRLYDPTKPLGLANPGAVTNTDLTDAFMPDVG